MPTKSQSDEFKVLLMINRRGFRHTEQDRALVASQINWAYDDAFRECVPLARKMMSYVQEQIFKLDKSLRAAHQTDTLIMLTRDSTDKGVVNKASEHLSHGESLVIDVSEISESEKRELADILSGSVLSSTAADVGSYLASMREDVTMSGRIATGMQANVFLGALGDNLIQHAAHLVPLYMTQTRDENGHSFNITLTSKSPGSNYAIRIGFKI